MSDSLCEKTIHAPTPEVLVIVSFHPEMALFRNLCVNLRVSLCDVHKYVSAKTPDFLDLAENYLFPNWKLISTSPDFPDGN
jgi:hypothetical protein